MLIPIFPNLHEIIYRARLQIILPGFYVHTIIWDQKENKEIIIEKSIILNFKCMSCELKFCKQY